MKEIKIYLTLVILTTGYSLWGQNSIKPVQDRKKESTTTPVPSKLKKFMPSRHNQKLKEAKEGSFDLIMIGDSITHNWESEKNFEKIFTRLE